jgi:chromosome segregation ATPase
MIQVNQTNLKYPRIWNLKIKFSELQKEVKSKSKIIKNLTKQLAISESKHIELQSRCKIYRSEISKVQKNKYNINTSIRLMKSELEQKDKELKNLKKTPDIAIEMGEELIENLNKIKVKWTEKLSIAKSRENRGNYNPKPNHKHKHAEISAHCKYWPENRIHAKVRRAQPKPNPKVFNYAQRPKGH